MVLIDHEEIIEITTDRLGRVHRRVNIERCALREGREHLRQDGLLDLPSHIQVILDLLQLRMLDLRFLDKRDLFHRLLDGSF